MAGDVTGMHDVTSPVPSDPFHAVLLHKREVVRSLARGPQEIWAIDVQRCLTLSLSLDAMPEQLEEGMEQRTSAEMALLRAEARLRYLDAVISLQAPPPFEAVGGFDAAVHPHVSFLDFAETNYQTRRTA